MNTFVLFALWQACHGVRTRPSVILEELTNGRECCCREGRCDPNQHSHDKEWTGVRAIEPVIEGNETLLCCIRSSTACSKLYRSASWHNWSKPWFPKDERYCENEKEKAIHEAIRGIPNSRCREAFWAFIKRIADKVGEFKHKMFHGTEIVDVHDAHAAENIVHQILILADQFREGMTGASFFKHGQQVKLLWNRIEKKLRKAWKTKLNAGELSRDDDTIFAQIVEDGRVNHLKSCDYNSVGLVQNVWRIASLSYAGLAREKHLVILLGASSKTDLEKTMLWKAELHGVAESPPKGKLSIISIGGLSCEKATGILKEKIESEAEHTPLLTTIRDKWKKTKSFTCREAKPDEPDLKTGDEYMPPFGEHLFDWALFAKQGGRELFRKWYSQSDCIQMLLVKKEPDLCHDYKRFKRIVDFESDDSAVKEIAKHCPNLETINLYGTQVTDIGVKELAKNCANLREVWLQRTKVTDIGVKDIAANCPNLQTITLDDTAVTDEGVKELSAHCPNLTEIDLRGTKVTDVGVKELAKNCANLQEVWLSGTKVTDIGVKELSAHCPNLETIFLDNTKVTDVGVKDIAANCPNLKGINLHSTKVTDEGVKELAHHCPNLETIILEGIKVGDLGVKEASKIRPGATFYSDHGNYKNGEK